MGRSGWLAALLTVSLTLVGCDDSSSADRDPVPVDPVTPSQVDLRSALLTLDDMPAGWSEIPYDADAESNVCPAQVAGPLGLDEEPPTAGVQYVASRARGPSFAEAIQVVPSGRGAELMPIVRDAMADCDGEVYSGRTARVSKLDFPRVGDGSAAYTIRLDGVAINVLYAVTGDVTLIMSTYDLTGGDSIRLLERYAERAVDKAEDAFG
jgi:hypothetical protein